MKPWPYLLSGRWHHPKFLPGKTPSLMIRHTFKPRQISLSSPASPTSSTSHTPSKPNTPREQEQEQEQYQTLPKSPCHSSSSSTLPSSLSEAAIVIANNEDLLTQILLCLPPKSLLCFQSVSKGWLSTISNPIFRRLHSLVYPTSAASCSPASLLLLRRDRSPLVFDFIAFRPEEVNSMASIVSHLNAFLYGRVSAFHSCNGLLAMVFRLSCSQVKEFVVYDPTTWEFKLIPTIDTVDCYKVLNIVFDPVKSDHYKLICICWDRSESSVYRFSVYSSEIGVWKNTGEMEIEELICEREVLWNGDLHWISHWNYSVCFDVDNECIGPHRYAIREPGKHADVWYFGESGGRLFYIDVNEPQGMLFDVFELELKRDCLYWSVKYQVDLAPLTTLYPQILNENCSLSFEERFEFYTTSFLWMGKKESKPCHITCW